MNLNKLTRQLYPTGRAFRFPHGKNGYLVHDAINESVGTCVSELHSILDTILPDNDNFTSSDAAIWERRLGLPAGTDLQTQKLAIMRKLNYPGGCLGRMSLSYFQSQLQAAGFNVFVFANKFPDGMGGYTVINPGDGSGSYTQHGIGVHGVSVHGTTGFPYDSVISNHTDKTLEPAPAFNDSQLRATFFICGSSFPNMAAVPAEREEEFRKLILTLKGSHLTGFLLINYI